MTLKTVCITGASAGIGAATARRFAKEGFRLVLLARRLDKLEALRNELQNCDVLPLALDVSVKEAVIRTFSQIENKWGGIDVLVNNAGGAFGLDLAQSASLEDWEKAMAVNINGLVYCTHSVLPGMVKRNTGHIVNIGSVAGRYPYPGGNVYGAAKAFVHQFSQNLLADLLGTQVRVSCIEPGLVGETEFSHVRFSGDLARAKKVYEDTTPLKPEDVAEVIYFCTSAPAHVNINHLEMMPVMQAFSSLAVHRRKS